MEKRRNRNEGGNGEKAAIDSDVVRGPGGYSYRT